MPPGTWNQGMQQQTQLIEAHTEHLRETFGQTPDSGQTA